MMSEEQLQERLQQQGHKAGDIRATMRDIGKLIVARAAAEYFMRLPEDVREQLSGVPETELRQYLAEHRDSLPAMSQEEFERIHDATWEEYFASIK